MYDLRQNSIYLLQGLVVTFAVLGAIGTIAGLLLICFLTVGHGSIAAAIEKKVGHSLEGGVALTAIIEAAVWILLPRVYFISRSLGKRMAQIMGGIALFTLAMLLFSL